MNATLAPGVSLSKVAEIVRNAVLCGPDAWDGGGKARNESGSQLPSRLLPSDGDMIELFSLLRDRNIQYLLVGGIAVLRYVGGRNTQDVDLLMSLVSLRRVPEITIEDQNEFFIRGKFKSVRVDILLTANPLFAEVQRDFATSHRFSEVEVSTATPEGLILLKLYALPSLYRQGLIDRAGVYELDIFSLINAHKPATEPILARLKPHLEAGDLHELGVIIKDIEIRLSRSEKFKKP